MKNFWRRPSCLCHIGGDSAFEDVLASFTTRLSWNYVVWRFEASIFPRTFASPNFNVEGKIRDRVSPHIDQALKPRPCRPFLSSHSLAKV